MNASYGCGIIDKGVSSSGGRIVFNDYGFAIKGGLLDKCEYEFNYFDIKSLQYSVVVPKIHFISENESYIVNLTFMTRFRLRKILKIFKENNVQCCVYHSESKNLLAKIRDWYGFWYKGKALK